MFLLLLSLLLLFSLACLFNSSLIIYIILYNNFILLFGLRISTLTAENYKPSNKLKPKQHE